MPLTALEIANLGTMVLRYQLEGWTLQTELVVSDEIDERIFGYDWLVAHDCRWYFKECVVFVHETPVGLHMRHTRAKVIIGAINAVRTCRQATHDTTGNTEPGHDPAGPPTELARSVETVDMHPDGEGTATASRTRRRRRRKRGKRHVLSHTSTEVRDLVPEGEWTAEYLSAQQQADDDLGQVHKWKLGTMERPSWSVMQG